MLNMVQCLLIRAHVKDATGLGGLHGWPQLTRMDVHLSTFLEQKQMQTLARPGQPTQTGQATTFTQRSTNLDQIIEFYCSLFSDIPTNFYLDSDHFH